MLLEPCDFRPVRWPPFKAGDIVNVGNHKAKAVIVWIEDDYARLWWLDKEGQQGYPMYASVLFLTHHRD